MAANNYTSQTISGYNSSPPPDDGTKVTANKVTWSGIKSKLGDPVKTLAEAINTELNTSFGELVMTTDAAEVNVILHVRTFL